MLTPVRRGGNRGWKLGLGHLPLIQSLDYYRDGHRGLSLVRTSAGGPSNQDKQTWQEFKLCGVWCNGSTGSPRHRKME
jgi:hypothetical protein